MKVLLIKPTLRANTDSITPSVGLGYLATALRPYHEVLIVDGPKIKLNQRKFARILRDFKPDMVGFNLISLDLYITVSYLRVVREVVPNAVTVVGGPHPSGQPENTFHNCKPNLDYAFIGEAERGLSMLAEAIEKNRGSTSGFEDIPGLVWKDNEGFHKNPMYREPDLDSLGFPAWDLMDPRTYPPAPHAAFAKGFPIGNISTSRGCPFNCEFCAAGKIQGRKIRRRSIGHIMDEIELLTKRYGIKELHIIDDNFTFNRDYTLEFCEQLAKRFEWLTWTCPNGVRLDSLDQEMLTAMKRSGCYALAVGIESGSQSVLDRASKKQTIELVREKVELINSMGISVIGFFVLGFPGETAEEIQNTIDFSLNLPLTRAQYMLFHPIPGTDLHAQLSRDHPERLRNVYSSLEKVAYLEEGMTEKQLKMLHRIAFLRFYLRPRQFFELMASIRSPSHAYYIIKRTIRWMVTS